MERAIGLLMLITLPLAAVTNLFRAVGFYAERVGKLAVYGTLLVFLGRRGADMVIKMEAKRLRKQSIELWRRRERLMSFKEGMR